MKEKNNYDIFEEFILNAIRVQILNIDGRDDVISSILDEMELLGIEGLDEQISAHENIYWVYLELPESEYYKIQVNKMDVKDVKSDFFYYTVSNDITSTLHLFEIVKVRIPKQRKSIEELEIELNQAVKSEDYVMAAKLHKDIEIKRNKYIKKNTTKKKK